MKKNISLAPTTRTLLFYALSVLCLTALYILFWLNVTRQMSLHYFFVFFTESMLFLSPMTVLRGRWRIIGPLTVWFIWLVLYCNVLFARFNGDLIPATLAFHAASYNSTVISCIPGLIRAHDILYLILALIPTLAYRYLSISTLPSLHHMWIVPALSAAAYTACIVDSCDKAAYHHDYPWAQRVAEGFRLRTGLLKDWNHRTSMDQYYEGAGSILYTFVQYNCYREGMPLQLSPEQRHAIDNFIADSPTAKADSAFAANSSKNLIFIVVESLNAWTVDFQADGHKLTPSLDSLRHLPGSITALNVIPQIGPGESGDGQMMYNTGLLPLKNTSAPLNFDNNSYIALPHLLDREVAEEFICEDRKIWNHHLTTHQYGYDTLFCNHWPEKGRTSDQLVLDAAVNRIPTLPQPFFTFITTSTTHFPFSEDFVPRTPWIEALDLDGQRTAYLNSVHHTDSIIGDFLRRLDADGILANSIVLIASDHHTGVLPDSPAFDPLAVQPIVFMALNTGRTIDIDRTVAQVDVFPTILDIMGCTASWRGVGTSILDEHNNSAVDIRGNIHGTPADSTCTRKRDAWHISDLIIRGNYFGQPAE